MINYTMAVCRSEILQNNGADSVIRSPQLKVPGPGGSSKSGASNRTPRLEKQ